jgi:hypothetical protein
MSHAVIVVCWSRLSDAEWAHRLREDPPSRPAWTSGFLPLHSSEIVSYPLKLVAPPDAVAHGDELTYTFAVELGGPGIMGRRVDATNQAKHGR